MLIEPTTPAPERIGIDESQWRDDPASLADWETWIKTFEPLKFTPDEAVRIAEFDERTRRFNMEGVTRQMQEGAGE